MKKRISFLAVCLTGIVGLTGCATNTAVDEKIAASQARTEQKIEAVGQQVESLQQRQRQTEEELSKISREAADALRRANEAGVLAKGKVVFEETFTEDRVRFNLESSELTAEAKTALAEFAQRVKAVDTQYYIEVQGHTDSTGNDRYNDDLAQDRADAVRRFLAREQTLPLQRMSTISYGESMPAADNSTREGRKQNRRVVLIVLE
ncbi:MAG TPA: OmpA family protein [Thermoanaerobaculia bacterium]|nr:OmpA family protein [Thermoanaerobaculia bacterium]